MIQFNPFNLFSRFGDYLELLKNKCICAESLEEVISLIQNKSTLQVLQPIVAEVKDCVNTPENLYKEVHHIFLEFVENRNVANYADDYSGPELQVHGQYLNWIRQKYNINSKYKNHSLWTNPGFYVLFNSQGHIGTDPKHCHFWDFIYLFYLFGVLCCFQHCTGHITMGIWKGRGNQYIQFVRDLYCKLPTNGKQLPAFPLEPMTGIEPRPQRWEVRVLPLCHRGPLFGT